MKVFSIDVRYTESEDIQFIIVRNTIYLKQDLTIPIGRYDAFYTLDNELIDELFDIYDLRLFPKKEPCKN